MSTIVNYGTIAAEEIEDSEVEESQPSSVAPFEPMQIQEPAPAPPVEWYKMPFCCVIEVCACVLEACLPYCRR
ncbi:hypothetical protein CAEBREN_03352 [Caenorhabditis brenneri]|uniref:Uncharacterized protein n=1 Tax=Caenorhabditis brenneri TaxID=135651 RepID=G0MBF5_CAEBE|nr:hypothetical protein CAEBREN_03352 [Caenorhabditis brenneri]